MTQEEKELLLQDLCGRLPHGVQILTDTYKKFDGGCEGKLVGIIPRNDDEYLFYQKGSLTPFSIEEIRPYLRPMSSMTKEEICQYKVMNDALDENYEVHIDSTYPAFDWLNKNMFDYRGLIPMGLALEAKEGIVNNTK